MSVELHAEIDPGVVELFGLERVPSVAGRAVDHGIHLWLKRLERNVAQIAGEPLEHLGAAYLTFDLCRTEGLHQRVPVCIFCIEPGERTIHVIDAGVGNDRGVSQPGILACKAADELDRDCDALVMIVQRRDFQLR